MKFKFQPILKKGDIGGRYKITSPLPTTSMEDVMVEFVSYDGAYPNLCSGTLIVRIDGIEYSLRYVLCSGGHTCWTGEKDEIITGDWELDLYDYPELQPYEQELTTLVNANVRKGCCGGCL